MDTYTVTVSSFPDVYNVNISSPFDYSHGGTMNGDLIVKGSLSASEYLNLPPDTDTLNSVTTRGNTTTNSISVSGLSSSFVKFNTSSTPLANSEGLMQWNNTDGTLNIGLKGGNVTLQVGQEEVIRVVNKSGSDLLESEFKVVRVRSVDEGGAQGQRLAVVLAKADNDTNSATTLGIVTENISNNQEGFITTFGEVRGINTKNVNGEVWSDGDMLYLSPSNLGRLTNVKPQAPNHTVIMGYVVYAHVTNGKIFVKVDNGYELDELHNVRIDNVQEGEIITYDSAIGVWKNSNTISTLLRIPEIQGIGGTNSDTLAINNCNFVVNGGSSNILYVDAVNYNVGIGTDAPTASLDVNGTFNVAGNTTLIGTTIATGKITANGQGNVFDLASNDVMTRDAVDYEAMVNGNQFSQLAIVTTQNSGTGTVASSHNVFGMAAQVSTTANTTASVYTYDNIHTHTGYSGNQIRSDRGLEFFAHGVMLRVENNTNWIMRINFGVGTPTRVPPLAGVAASSSTRQWGVEFYYDGSNYVGRLYWYDTSIQYGTPFVIPSLTLANWTNMVYSIRMRQTASGLLEIYMNTPTASFGGTRLPNTPISSVNATWTSTSLGGRYINFECATAAAAAPTTGARIHCARMFCKYN